MEGTKVNYGSLVLVVHIHVAVLSAAAGANSPMSCWCTSGRKFHLLSGTVLI